MIAVSMSRRFLISALSATALTVSVACNVFHDPSSTSPSAGALTDTFSGTLPQGGSLIFSGNTTTSGNVTVTLTSTSPASPGLGMSLGVSNNGICSVSVSTSSAVAGTTPQLTTTLAAGAYCVKVYDVGTLTANVSVTIAVSHS